MLRKSGSLRLKMTLLTRLLLYLVPVLIVAGMLNLMMHYRRVSRIYAEEIRTLGRSQAERVRREYEYRFESILNAAFTMAYRDPELEEFVLKFRPDYFYKTGLMNKLEFLITDFQEIRSVYIYLAEKDVVVSTETGRFYPMESFYHPEPLTVTKPPLKPIVIMDQYRIELFGQERTYLSLCISFPVADGSSTGVLVFNLDMPRLYHKLVSEFGLRNDRFLSIRTQKGTLLFSNLPRESDDSEGISVNAVSSVYDLEFRIDIDPAAFDRIRTGKIGVYAVQVLAVTLGTVLLLWILFSYALRPLKDLVRRVTAKNPEIEGQLSAVGAYVEWLAEENKDLRKRYAQAFPFYQSRFVLDLLEGRVPETEVFERCEHHDIVFPSPYFTALCVRISREALANREFDLLRVFIGDHLESYFKRDNGPHGYAVDMGGDGFGVILNFPAVGDDVNRGLHRLTDSMSHSLPKEIRDRIFFGIGTIVESPCRLETSFMEARRTLDYKLSVSSSVVSAYDVHRFESSEYEYPYRREEDLSTALRNSDVAEVTGIIDDIIDSALAARLDRWELDFVTMRLLDVLNRYSFEQRLNPGEDGLLRGCQELLTSESAGAVKTFFAEAVMKLMSLALQHKDSADRVMEEIIVFIRTNHSNKTLQLIDLEERFNLGRYYLSHRFKQYTGRYFNDFLHDVRIDSAVDMLKNTYLSVKEISDRVGYAYPYYFIRKFKKRHGVTPKEYRDRNSITDS